MRFAARLLFRSVIKAGALPPPKATSASKQRAGDRAPSATKGQRRLGRSRRLRAPSAGGKAARGWRSEPELCALTQPGLRALFLGGDNAAEGRDHSSQHGPNLSRLYRRDNQKTGRPLQPTTMERAVEGGQAAAYPECGFSTGGRGADSGQATAPRGRGGLAAAPRGRGGAAYFIAPI